MNLTMDELRLIKAGLIVARGKFGTPVGTHEALFARVQRELAQGGSATADPGLPIGIALAVDRYLDAVAEVQPVVAQTEAWSAVMGAVHKALRVRLAERAGDDCGPRSDGGWRCRPWRCSRETECLLTGATDLAPSLDEQITAAQDEVLRLSENHPTVCRDCVREDAQKRLWALLELKRERGWS